MNNPETLARLGKQNTGKTKKNKKTQHRKLKRQVTTDPTKQQGWTQVLVKGKQFLPLIRHLSCYSYSLHISVMHSVLKDLIFLYRSSSKKVKTFVENIYELLRSTERESVIGADFNIDLIKPTWQHLILSYVTISVSRTILTDIKTNNIFIELWSTWFSQQKKIIIIIWKLLFRPSCCVCFVSRDFQVQKCTIFAHYSYQYQHWVSITKLSYYVYMLALVEVYEKKVHWWSPIPTISPKQANHLSS